MVSGFGAGKGSRRRPTSEHLTEEQLQDRWDKALGRGKYAKKKKGTNGKKEKPL